MMLRHPYALLLACVLPLVGCQDPEVIPLLDGSALDADDDGGVMDDSSTPNDDGGVPDDSSALNDDGGVPDDSGPLDDDGGAMDDDAGPTAASRAAALQLYADEYLASDIETNGWTGMFVAPATCVPGTIPQATRQAGLRRINYYRTMAGVEPIDGLAVALNESAQAAALISLANLALIFGEPPMSAHLPQPDWACYSELGQQGAASGNISFGLPTVSAALDAFMEDPGPANGNAGHRRAMLNPHAVAMGLGATDRTVVQPTTLAAERPNQFVGWPPAGFVPAPLVFPRWSMVNWQALGLADSVVTMRDDEGVEIPVRMVGTSPRNANAVWEPQGTLDLSDGATYHVTIEGFTIRGDDTPQRHEYTVTLVVP